MVNGKRIVLGTAQLGMAYGIANRSGRPDQVMANEIVRAAWENGIREFDTAQGYKNSEAVLGIALKEIAKTDTAAIVTKFSPSANCEGQSAVRQLLKESLSRLGCKKLFGVMLHDETMLDRWDDGLGEIMAELVDEGITQFVGVSVYSPERARQAINIDQISLIQIPTNILDRRFEKAGVFDAAESNGKTLYIRSIFLQGLILIAENDLPMVMKHAAPVIRQVASVSKRLGRTPMEIAMAFVETAYPKAKIVIGAETPEQVRHNASIVGNPLSTEQIRIIQETFQNIDPDLLNPACWPV